jgi:hypothetical protein
MTLKRTAFRVICGSAILGYGMVQRSNADEPALPVQGQQPATSNVSDPERAKRDQQCVEAIGATAKECTKAAASLWRGGWNELRRNPTMFSDCFSAVVDYANNCGLPERDQQKTESKDPKHQATETAKPESKAPTNSEGTKGQEPVERAVHNFVGGGGSFGGGGGSSNIDVGGADRGGYRSSLGVNTSMPGAPAPPRSSYPSLGVNTRVTGTPPGDSRPGTSAGGGNRSSGGQRSSSSTSGASRSSHSSPHRLK